MQKVYFACLTLAESSLLKCSVSRTYVLEDLQKDGLFLGFQRGVVAGGFLGTFLGFQKAVRHLCNPWKMSSFCFILGLLKVIFLFLGLIKAPFGTYFSHFF